MSFPTTSSTFNSIAPSSINIFVPGSTSLYNSLYVTETFSSSPVMSSLTNVNFCPSFSWIFVFLPVYNIPVLISGPFISNNIGIGRSFSSLILIIVSDFSDCSSQLPCE